MTDGIKIRQIVEGMNIGGGHDYAAGGTFKAPSNQNLDTQTCLNQVFTWLENNHAT